MRCFVRPFKPVPKAYQKEVTRAAFSSIATHLAALEDRPKEGRKYIVDTFTVADIVVGTRFSRLQELGLLEFVIGDNSNVRAYWSRLKQRECLKVACEPPQRTKGSQAILDCL